LAEGRALDLEQILELQRLKTGALIGCACEAGALLGGGSAAARAALRGYAADLGLAFQIQDDLLDVTGDAEITGKDLGRDAAVGKATVVALLGVEGSRCRLEELRSSALAHLDRLEGETGVLRAVFDFGISRSSRPSDERGPVARAGRRVGRECGRWLIRPCSTRSMSPPTCAVGRPGTCPGARRSCAWRRSMRFRSPAAIWAPGSAW